MSSKENLQIFGTRAIIEAVEAGEEVDKVFLQRGVSNPLTQELTTLIRKKGIPVSFVPVEKLNKLTPNNHQGAVATISPIPFHNFEALVERILEKEEVPLLLLLDGLSDVRNFGAIIRTAACTGVHAIIIPKKGGAPVNADTVKTSAGAAFKVPITKVDHLKDAIYYLQGSGVQIVAATEKSNTLLYHTDLTKPTAIVMGSEQHGVSSGLLKLADHSVKLPMTEAIASLNVSVACGAFLYEIVRQRLD